MADNNELPNLGASALTVLSIEKERKLGEVIFNELRGRANVLYDPLINEYVNSLGNRLVAHAQDVKFPFTFFAVNSPDLNAFAFYGGYIGVHTGLIATAETESQLASVLGHEIAHVTQRHLARRQEAAAKQQPLTIAGIIGSLLLSVVNPQAMLATMMATTAGAQQSAINHTRGNEQEADNIGMNILASAGYDPHAAGEFFAKLQQQVRYKAEIPAFLVTHPLPDSRVTDARLRAQQFERRYYADSLDFLMMKARVEARFQVAKEHNVIVFEDKVEKSKGDKKLAAQYGLAISYLDKGQLELAERLLLQLDQALPNNLYLLDTLSDLAIAKKAPALALPKLKKAYQYRPNNSVVTLNYANVLLESDETKKATQLLEYYLLAKPNDFLATQILRQAYKKSENMAKYYATSAEYYALVSNYSSAIKSVDRALSVLTPEDSAEINRLEALKINYRRRLTYIQEMKGV